MAKYRIVTDSFAGYEVQIKRWWFPFWFQCWEYGCINSFISVERAEQYVKDRKKHKVVKYID